jgi:hypothetical protein
VFRCFNPDACIGGAAANKTADKKTDFQTAQCSGPYKGNLCGECKQGYGRVRPFLCRKCMSAGTIILLYLLAAVAVVGLVKLLVYFSTSTDLVTRTDLQTPTPSEMLRALVIHSQWLFIICNLVGIPWPAALTDRCRSSAASGPAPLALALGLTAPFATRVYLSRCRSC